MLRAYFDASHRPSGSFAVAGYAFAKQQVKKFDREWWQLFRPYGGCHMKELAHGIKRFEGTDTGRLIKDAVKIIRRRISFGVVVSCDTNELRPLLPTWIDGYQHAYPVCCHLAMDLLGRLVRESGHDDEIAYFFESGDEFSRAAHRFMDYADRAPELKEAYRHHSHTFIDKDKALALQAADILAWEWTKYLDETVAIHKRNMRMSLVALLEKDGLYNDKKYRVNHVTGEPLRTYMAGITKLGLLEAEERVAKNR